MDFQDFQRYRAERFARLEREKQDNARRAQIARSTGRSMNEILLEEKKRALAEALNRMEVIKNMKQTYVEERYSTGVISLEDMRLMRQMTEEDKRQCKNEIEQFTKDIERFNELIKLDEHAVSMSLFRNENADETDEDMRKINELRKKVTARVEKLPFMMTKAQLDELHQNDEKVDGLKIGSIRDATVQRLKSLHKQRFSKSDWNID